jgi:protoporphyrinogen/coproporphyrinogen III oxidase
VIGSGVSGLAAAWRLQQRGVDVIVLEAGGDVGGQVRTVEFDGRRVDVGAEGLHLANPATAALLTELGLLDHVIEARSGGTWIEVGGRLRPLPAGVGPAGPTRLWPVATSGVLTARGLARAALEPLHARRRRAEDVSVGDLVAERFGRQVVDRLVDPLLGGIHAGDVRRLSLRACAPQLVTAVEQGRSMALRRTPSAPAGVRPPGLVTWAGGLRRLVDELTSRLAEPVRLRAEVTSLRPEANGEVVVELRSGERLAVDTVVVATPARVAARLLSPLAPAAIALEGIRTASVATVLVALSPEFASHPALAGTGILVPSASGRLLRAATFLTSKWPHLGNTSETLVRLSTGRAGQGAFQTMTDDELTAALLADLADLLGRPAGSVRPTTSAVHRWPSSMPQQDVGHGALVEGVRRELAVHAPWAALAGASFDGVGVAACLRSGELASERLLADAPNDAATSASSGARP